MKRILALALILITLSTAVSAQRPGDRIRRQRIVNGINNDHLTRPEAFQLRKDALRYRAMDRNARRDGFVSPYERKKLHKIRRKNRVKEFRYKHNPRRRLI
jgi:hypothetical protein